MCSRPILKHFPQLEPTHPIPATSPLAASYTPSPSALPTRTSSSSSLSAAIPPSPTLGVFPFASCSSANLLYSPHVHFPPTPRLISSTHLAHSPTTYDRAPIVVQPNSCSLPERGGRMCYTPHSTRRRSSAPKGSYFHPTAYEACEREDESHDDDDDPSAVISALETPELTSDSSTPSSDSDYSDGWSSPPEELQSPLVAIASASSSSLSYLSGPAMSLIHAQSSMGEYPTDMRVKLTPPAPRSAMKLEGGRQADKKPRKRAKVAGSLRIGHTFSDDSSLDGCLGGF
ncbi:hypothetical protein PLEOSDRAFT_156213 [Pleurotus ostreatus PC15]|uniref:Uncharacterized protein n=1 Tax=Pleurotus ostreatus (strain PC15) TaxID=1137138 RepID=A0A067NTZ5_PLEO1|nr:hypothetical protein PLEOSDRAFT_156213 [Pleurotus ostreatus PC15]